ncbi:hypothetical protein CP965_00820 [Halarcobacter mediterraneus]|uniref:Uncharacterized protein n=1 Tax=Halarcobacter mediterraneus TaxID=2023153 RepID=A0A4Q1AXH1_9BACT|nr:hypothetical protein [Halarcobacter mediterraneus]RXK14023.1 hypothetical protein CP965_00820 [Halarcobacter mediterraneus]
MFRDKNKVLYLVYFEFNKIYDPGNMSTFVINDQNSSIYLKRKKKLSELRNNVERDGGEIYDLSDNKNLSKESEIVNKIKKSNENIILFITNNKKLFTNFNRPIYLFNIDEESLDLNSEELVNVNMNEIISFLKSFQTNEIKQKIYMIFFIYGIIFELDIKLLIKDTAYEVKEKNELIDLINEDLDLYIFKRILTSRLSIILYRLFFFDLNAKKTAVGRFFRNSLNVKSETYSFKNLNNNHEGFYFTSLENKSFRGYKIPFYQISLPDNIFVEKIKIAKKLLKLNVKKKIVSEALEISEDEIDTHIYGDDNLKPTNYIETANKMYSKRVSLEQWKE